MRSKSILVFIVVLQTTFLLAAQPDTLLINHNSKYISGKIIKPYTNKWKVTLIKPTGEKVENKIWTDYGQLIELNGIKYFHRVQNIYDAQMNLLDTWINMVEHNSLIPVRFTSIKPNGEFSYITFNSTRIESITNINSKDGSLTNSSNKVKEGVFDWNLYGMLLVGLPLKTGIIAKIPFFDSQTNTTNWLIVEVIKKEKIVLPNEQAVETWKIKTNQNLTFWISKESPYVIKLELQYPNSAKLLWEVFK